MAYNSNTNYAADLIQMMDSGIAGANSVNYILNQRIEKMQAQGLDPYDDVTRRAMEYIAARGDGSFKASDNIDYKTLADSILAADPNQNRYYEDLYTALAARGAKLGTGNYDQWADAKTDDGYAYNGAGSLQEIVGNHLINQQIANLPQLGSMQAPVMYQGIPAEDTGLDVAGTSGSTTGGSSSGSYGYSSGGGSAYPSMSAEDAAAMYRAARDAVANTHAGTRSMVNGENSSYVQDSTSNAYRDALAALEEYGLKEAAGTMRADQANWQNTDHVGRITRADGGAVTPATSYGGGYSSYGSSGYSSGSGTSSGSTKSTSGSSGTTKTAKKVYTARDIMNDPTLMATDDGILMQHGKSPFPETYAEWVAKQLKPLTSVKMDTWNGQYSQIPRWKTEEEIAAAKKAAASGGAYSAQTQQKQVGTSFAPTASGNVMNGGTTTYVPQMQILEQQYTTPQYYVQGVGDVDDVTLDHLLSIGRAEAYVNDAGVVQFRSVRPLNYKDELSRVLTTRR